MNFLAILVTSITDVRIVDAPGATNINANLETPRKVSKTILVIAFAHYSGSVEHAAGPQFLYPILSQVYFLA